MYRGIVKKVDPHRKKGEHHHIEFDDGDKKWHNLAKETVIWPDGTVTDPGAKWKEAEAVQAGGGSGGKTRGRRGRSVTAGKEEKEVGTEVDGVGEQEFLDIEAPDPAVPAPTKGAAAAEPTAEAEPAAAATAVEESKKRKAPPSPEKPSEAEAPVVEAPAVEAVEAPAAPQAEEQQKEQQQEQQQQQQQQQKPASPEKQPASKQPQPSASPTADERQPKKARTEHQKVLPGAAKPPPPPPPGAPPSRRETPSTTAALGAATKPQPGPKQQQQQQKKPQQQPPPALPADPKLAALQQKHRLLQAAIDKHTNALDALKTSTEAIKSLVKELESENVLDTNKVGLPKLVGKTVKHLLLPPSGGGGGAGGGGWFEVHGTKWLNDVPEAMASMRNLRNTWGASCGQTLMPEGPQMKAWAAERTRLNSGGSGNAAAAGAPGANDKRPASAQQQPPQPPQQQQVQKVDEDTIEHLIPSTGSPKRDQVVRVLAHALVTATTPIDAAREMEQAMFYQYCRRNTTATDNKAATTGAEDPNTTTGAEAGAGAIEDSNLTKTEPEAKVNEAYYNRMRTIWAVLSPKSPTCHPILRYMLLSGIVSPSEMVNITAENLKIKQEEAMKEMGECKAGWLAEQLRNVQLPYYPPATTDAEAEAPEEALEEAAAEAKAAVPGEEGGPPEAGVPVGVGAVEKAETGPKVVDMELD
jgi:hypothetical protein